MGQARFERQPTMKKRRGLIVGWHGKTPLVPLYIFCNFNLDGAVGVPVRWLWQLGNS